MQKQIRRTRWQEGTKEQLLLKDISEVEVAFQFADAETALQIEEVLPEIPARFWLNMETDYQLTKALENKRVKGSSRFIRERKQ